jgi:hypothetical protein
MNESIYTLILSDINLQAKLMMSMQKSWQTIYRWAKHKDVMLTTKIASETIDQHIQELEAIKTIKTEAISK